MPSPDRTAGGDPESWKPGGGLCLMMLSGFFALLGVVAIGVIAQIL